MHSATEGFYFQAFNGSVALPVAGYDYNSDWTPLLAGLSPAGMAASLAAPEPYVRLSRIRLVWDFLCQGCITPFLSYFVASFFVRPAPRAFFRPDRILPSASRTVTVKDGACMGLSLSRVHHAIWMALEAPARARISSQ